MQRQGDGSDGFQGLHRNGNAEVSAGENVGKIKTSVKIIAEGADGAPATSRRVSGQREARVSTVVAIPIVKASGRAGA
ncbi:MAG: hypothetical protein LAN62_04465 [Acidobacteriia bacterium]|nr:hypothetical protein [Terriglobia bacterium]